MALSLNPVDMAMGLPRQQLQWAQSLHKVVNGGLDFGSPEGKDSSGNYNTFSPGNTNGALIRVGASGTTDNKYAWTTSNSPISIVHGLTDSKGAPRQPVGVHIVNKNKAVDIYMPTAPNINTASVAPTDATAAVTLYFF